MGHCYEKDKLQVFQMFGKVIWTSHLNIIHRLFVLLSWKEFLKPTVDLKILKYPWGYAIPFSDLRQTEVE